ncbi:MAG: OmpA family protein [Taibaiella sp.]|nr:OmpA family protein [Taibaiella sp.]
MKKSFYSITGLLLAATVMTSCVSNRRFREATRENMALHNSNTALQSRVSAEQDSINALRSNVNALGDVYQATSNELNMSKEQIAAQRQRVLQLEGLIASQQKNTEALRKKIADALVSFNTNELTVSMKNGKVYVSMQESLLFPSGSAVVNTKGKDALAKLSGVLNVNPDINVEVEGHTDSIPIHTKVFVDNWALSVTRATSIAHVMIDEYSVNPARITASGRSKYVPVAGNDTEQGRAMNRRTEIILQPKLDELMQVINGPGMNNMAK